MKKLLSLLIILSMIMSLSVPAFSAEKTDGKKILVANLSDMTSIGKTGLKASAEYAKSGNFTALLGGDFLKKTTTVPVLTSDFSGSEYLEFYVQSPVSTATAYAIALVSDNPATSGVDYYYNLVACNFKGWKNFSFRLKSLRTTGTPKGFDSIDKILIIPGHGGSLVDESAKIYLDNIYVTDVQSEDANRGEEVKTELEPLVLWEAKEGEQNVVNFDGKWAYKWGPGEDKLKNEAVPDIKPKAGIGMEKYKDLVVEMYAETNNNHPFICRLYGPDNPETSGSDFYFANFSINWSNSWKELRFAISGGMKDFGDFTHSDKKKPLFPPCETDMICFSAFPYTSSKFYPETVVYVTKVYLDGAREEKTVPNPTGEIILPDRYDEKTMTDYAQMVKEKHPNNHHPRLIITEDTIERIKKYKDTDAFMKKTYLEVKETADKYLTTPSEAPYHKDSLGTGYRFIRDVELIAKYCGMMYLLTGETKYADRVWQEVENMLNTDVLWNNTNTGLDCGHIATGYALAYDWLYDYLSKDQKRKMRNTLMTHAFDYASQIRDGGGYMAFRNNVVAANSKGFVTAALAICDEPGYENFCNEIISLAVKYLPTNVMDQFAPAGNYAEGIGYWRYCVHSILYSAIAIKNATGIDSGLEDQPGFEETSYLPFALTGITKTFNYSDASTDVLKDGDPIYFYLAERFNAPQLASFRLEKAEKTGSSDVEDLFWYDPEKSFPTDWRTNLPNDYVLDGLEPVAIFRTGYDPDSIYFGAKGGNSGTGHDHYDAGTFVLDANGVRWFEDLGAEEYYTDVSRNWYYRVRAEGHNCLSVDPQRGWESDQTIATNMYDTRCPIVASDVTDGASYAIFDNQPSYKEVFTDYKRGFALINNRTQIIVQDEFKTTAPYELYSYYHTSKNNQITINPDGKSLTMKAKNGSVCKVNFISDIPGFTIGVMDAVHHEASPKPGPTNTPGLDNSGYHKIYFHADRLEKGTITMVVTPLAEDSEIDLPEILPHSEWDKYSKSSVTVDSILIDGIPLSDFKSGTGVYKFESEKLGEVSANASADVDVSITQATDFGKPALIKATSKDTGKSFTYKVFFTKMTVPGVASGVKATSMHTPKISQPEHPPVNMTDGDLSTRFTMEGYDGSCTFTLDLGASRFLTSFSMAFYGGTTRKNKFKMEVSEDNNTFTEVFNGFSPGNTDQLVSYEITPIWGRYVRFTGYGCYADEKTQVSPWNSIAECVVHEKLVDFADTTGHWAQSEILFAREHNLVNGLGDNKYMPENSVTRAEFLTMMVRACKFTEYAYEEGTFCDVKKDDWYAANAMTALDKGIIPSEMIADGNLRPNEKLTREEMCAIAVLAYSVSAHRDVAKANMTSIFKDIETGPYLSYIDKAIGMRIVNGMSADTFAPKNTITRAQAAAILRRVYLKIFNVNN